MPEDERPAPPPGGVRKSVALMFTEKAEMFTDMADSPGFAQESLSHAQLRAGQRHNRLLLPTIRVFLLNCGELFR